MQTQQNHEIDSWISKNHAACTNTAWPKMLFCCHHILPLFRITASFCRPEDLGRRCVNFDFKRRKIKRSAGCCQMDFSKHRYSTQNTAVAPTLCSTCPPPKFLAPCSCFQVKYWPLLSPWIRRMNNRSATHEAFPAHVCLSWEALIRCINTNRHKPSPRFSPCSRQMKCLLIIYFFLKPPSSSIHESLSSSISRLSISELEVMG